MQVGAGNATGRPGQTDWLASLDDVTDSHVDFREMQIRRVQAIPVVDEDGVTAEEQIFGEDDTAAVRRVDRSARRRAQVGP